MQGLNSPCGFPNCQTKDKLLPVVFSCTFRKAGTWKPHHEGDAGQGCVRPTCSGHSQGSNCSVSGILREFQSWIPWTISRGAAQVQQDQEATVASPVSEEECHGCHLQINQKRVNDENRVFNSYCPRS